jgi:hypothetical protein
VVAVIAAGLSGPARVHAQPPMGKIPSGACSGRRPECSNATLLYDRGVQILFKLRCRKRLRSAVVWSAKHVTLLSLQVYIHDANHPGSDASPHAGALECGAGVPAAAQATVEVAAALRYLGWGVYVTTQFAARLSLPEAVLAYRNGYLAERAMGRLQGWPLSLTLMYLDREDHATGLICLLSIGLRALTLLVFGVHRRLAMAKAGLEGLYVGNPKRATCPPDMRCRQESSCSARWPGYGTAMSACRFSSSCHCVGISGCSSGHGCSGRSRASN